MKKHGEWKTIYDETPFLYVAKRCGGNLSSYKY
jgi:hypothetical protein